MARRLAGFMIDCCSRDLAACREFWSGALGLPVIDADEGGEGRYAVLGKVPGGWHVEVQCVEHDSRLHLDIEADDIDAEATRLEALGAQRIGNPRGRWWVMQAPTGHRFCVVRWRHDEAREPAPAQSANQPTHRSALIALVIDCRVEDIGVAADFWGAALDRPVINRDQNGDGRYAELHSAADEPFLLLQRVEHEARVHLDIETDDLEAEAARLEALGAERLRFVKRWWLMQAPTGHGFCVVGQQAAKRITKNAWERAESPAR